MNPELKKRDKPVASSNRLDALGGVVFEMKCNSALKRTGFYVGAFVAAFGAILLFVAAQSADPSASTTASASGKVNIALIAVTIMAGGGWMLLLSKNPTFRFHQNGVSCGKGNRNSTLLLEEIHLFTYDEIITTSAVPNVGYSHTTLNLKFEPVGKSASTVSARLIYAAQDGADKFAMLKQTVGNHIADRMQEQLRKGESVVWCSCGQTLVFHPQGLEVRNGKGTKSGTIIPFDQLSGYNFVGGVLHLFSERMPKQARMPAGVANFYPGWFLLFRIANIPEAPRKLWEKVLNVR